MKQIPVNKVHAPEIYGDFWFNSDPLTIHAMQGQVILLCFWDYTSNASLRVLKMVDEWYRRYVEMGLVVIGIHSPEFSFARSPKLVEAALQKLDLHFPVATDNTLMMRDAYRVRELPSLFLIERDGSIYFSHAGEGAHERAERSIQALLREAGFRGELPLLVELSHADDDVQPSYQRSTPAIRTGYLYGLLGNVEGYSPELPADYSDAHMYFEGKFYAHGNWLAKNDAFEFVGESSTGYITLRYSGRNVSVVLASAKKGAVVRLLQDDTTIAGEDRGTDVSVDSEGNTVVVVNEPKLYHIVQNKEFSDHTITIVPMEKGTTVYVFTFDAQPLSLLHVLGKNTFRNN